MNNHAIVQWYENNAPYGLVKLADFKTQLELEDYEIDNNFLVRWTDLKYYRAKLVMIGSFQKCESRLKKMTIDKAEEGLTQDGPINKRPSKKQKLKKKKKTNSTIQITETSQVKSTELTESRTPSDDRKKEKVNKSLKCIKIGFYFNFKYLLLD